jgi:4-hydroxybenzoate polyprenyltransferase
MLSAYLSLIRVDHWPKNLVIFFGAGFSFIVLDLPSELTWNLLWKFIIGFIGMCLASSANYVMNEYLDSQSDSYHPRKKSRASVQNKFSPVVISLIYLLLISSTFGILAMLSVDVSRPLTIVVITYFFFGVIYNVRPLRAKDFRYWDVIIESANNPIRLLFGWLLLSPETFPPFSLLLCFWSIGVFLMSSKRLAEFTELSLQLSREELGHYRKSLSKYTRNTLLILIVTSAQISAALLIVFALKYNSEFVFFFIIHTLWTSYFFTQIFDANSVAQAPEKLVQDKSVAFFAFGMFITLSLAYLDIPVVEQINNLLNSRVLDRNEIFRW